MATRRAPFLLTAALLALGLASSGAGAQPRAVAGASGRSLCDMCACTPDNVAPVAVNCTCSKTKLLIVRDQDAALLSSVRDLTLGSCGFVSLPPSGLQSSKSLVRVTIRDMKLFHYTAGQFPVLESLSVENVGELVFDGFGPANRTLRHLTLRRTTVPRLVKGTVTADSPLRRVLFDKVDIDEIEAGALDMVFVSEGNNGQAAADGFTVVDSTIESVASGGVTVRSGAVRILNSTLDDLASGSIVVDDTKGNAGFRLSGNRLGDMVGDSVSVLQSDGGGGGGDLYVEGNEFRTLPADMQLLKSERPVEFRDNLVANVDLGPFLFGVGPTVHVAGNRFVCDCDPRRISVLKLNQVFPGLLPDADNRLARLLADNRCQQPADTTLSGYRDLLIKEIACKGTNLTMAAPSSSLPTVPNHSNDTVLNRGNVAVTGRYATVLVAAAALSFLYVAAR